MNDINPDDLSAPDVVEALENASAEERDQIVAAELKGKKRKSVLEAAGVDADERRDASGRVLMAHEVSPENQAGGNPSA